VTWAASLLLSPLMLSIIARTKAFFAGRRGPPMLQPYRDLAKLLGKGAVYSRTTTWIFRAGPLVGLAAVLCAAALVPMGRIPAALSFPGDLVVFAYLLALARFAAVLAALDTGSAFEGMGASRETFFSALAEPALLFALAALCRLAGDWSLTGVLGNISGEDWLTHGPAILMAAGALFIVLLAENSRIPVDDPDTHLELTMIHEVMVLDHGGPDLAFILYGAALKLWTFAALLASLFTPPEGTALWVQAAGFLGCMAAASIAVGVVESVMARLRLSRVPMLLAGACALSMLALAGTLR